MLQSYMMYLSASAASAKVSICAGKILKFFSVTLNVQGKFDPIDAKAESLD